MIMMMAWLVLVVLGASRFGFLPELAKNGNEFARIYVLVARKLRDGTPITLRIDRRPAETALRKVIRGKELFYA